MNPVRRSGAGPGSRSARWERRAAIRERILGAALELIARDGLEGVTIERITEQAEVGKGTFFNYFASKEAVLATYLAERVQALQAPGAVPSGTDPRERIGLLLQAMAASFGRSRPFARCLLVAMLRLAEAEARNSLSDLEALMLEAVRQGQASGAFRSDVEPAEAAQFLLGQWFLAVLTWGVGRSPRSLEETVRGYLELAFEGIAAGPRAAA